MAMKNSNDTIGNRTRDFPVCSAVPQPLRHRLQSHLSPLNKNLTHIIVASVWNGNYRTLKYADVHQLFVYERSLLYRGIKDTDFARQEAVLFENSVQCDLKSKIL
jgi:hypothetical protein